VSRRVNLLVYYYRYAFLICGDFKKICIEEDWVFLASGHDYYE
jgi:hypothetical protein